MSPLRTLQPTTRTTPRPPAPRPPTPRPPPGADGRDALNATARTSLHVPPGWIERSGYVRAHRIRLATTDRMALGDLREKVEQLMGENHWRPGYQLSPPPKGYWEEDAEDGARNFVILDGRHRVVAALMWGYRHILVRWNAPLGEEDAADAKGAREDQA